MVPYALYSCLQGTRPSARVLKGNVFLKKIIILEDKPPLLLSYGKITTFSGYYIENFKYSNYELLTNALSLLMWLFVNSKTLKIPHTQKFILHV